MEGQEKLGEQGVMEQKTIHPMFQATELSEGGRAVVESVRREFSTMVEWLEIALPAGRQRSLCMTNLELACMFAVKAVSQDPMFRKAA